MNSHSPIYISGYPKSGLTWFTRLLGDVLNSPTGGSVPSEDAREIATEGQDRPGPYVVRKGHYRLFSETSPEPTPRPHCLYWRSLDGAPVFFIVRDPRDVAVSGAHHWKQSPHQFLDRMIRGDVARLPPWDRYVGQWLTLPIDVVVVKYEDLLSKPEETLTHIMTQAGLEFALERLSEAVERQSFANRKAQLQKDGDKLYLGKDYNVNFLRKGVAGDWRNHFNRQMGRETQEAFGTMLIGLEYEERPDWWTGLED